MEKMRMESGDMTAQNIDRIAALFPNCVTEMLDEERSTKEKKVYKRAINFELLKQIAFPRRGGRRRGIRIYVGRQKGGDCGSQ